MKKILNHLATDWYKYLLELIVITAGVLGAFSLNNWNEQNSLVKQERQMLLDIKSNLLANRDMLEFGRTINVTTLRHYEKLLDHIEEDLPYDDRLDSAFSVLNIWHSPFFTYTAYESLKSKGIDLISNNQLKTQISNIYDYHFAYLLGDYDKSEWGITSSVKEPLITRHVRFDEGRGYPVDFEELKKDVEFVNMISHLIKRRSEGILLYDALIENISTLIGKINLELNIDQ